MCVAMGYEPRRVGVFSKCQTVKEGAESGDWLQETILLRSPLHKICTQQESWKGFHILNTKARSGGGGKQLKCIK